MKVGSTLLDIGSGRGGDLGKWKRFSKILAVEPSLEHIEELKRRLASHPDLKNKVRILNAGGEETDKISKAVREFFGDRASNISLMLSLSFFWKEKKMFDALSETITQNLIPGGQFVFLTIDGRAVKELFTPSFDNQE